MEGFFAPMIVDFRNAASDRDLVLQSCGNVIDHAALVAPTATRSPRRRAALDIDHRKPNYAGLPLSALHLAGVCTGRLIDRSSFEIPST